MSFSMATDRIPFQQMMPASFHGDGSLTLPSMKLTIRADACPLPHRYQRISAEYLHGVTSEKDKLSVSRTVSQCHFTCVHSVKVPKLTHPFAAMHSVQLR